MDRNTLIQVLKVPIIDPFSCDTFRKGMKKEGNLYWEELFLKEVGNPNPKPDVYGNILCTLGKSEKKALGVGLLILQERSVEGIYGLSWASELAGSGIIVMGMDLDRNSPGKAVSQILRGVSYMDLRRDIIKAGSIFLLGIGGHAPWALGAAALDDRVAGIAVVDYPDEASPSRGATRSVSELAAMIQPRRFCLLGSANVKDEEADIRALYEKAGTGAFLRIEETGNAEGILKAVWWMIGKEMKE